MIPCELKFRQDNRIYRILDVKGKERELSSCKDLPSFMDNIDTREDSNRMTREK